MVALGGSTEDYIAIRRLQDAYADSVSRRAFAEFHDLFLPAAPVTVEFEGRTQQTVGPAEFGHFLDERLADFEFFHFVILNSVVELATDGDIDRATARLHVSAVRQSRLTGRFTVNYGVYRDSYVRVDERWWIESRRFSPLAESTPDLAVYGYPDIAPGRGAP